MSSMHKAYQAFAMSQTRTMVKTATFCHCLHADLDLPISRNAHKTSHTPLLERYLEAYTAGSSLPLYALAIPPTQSCATKVYAVTDL
jgi:hypothetical protein